MKATVAYCDCLGFSEMVEKCPVEAVVVNGLGRLRKVLHFSLHLAGIPDKVPRLSELQNHAHLGLAWFSDSIFIFTKQDTNEAVRLLLRTLGWLHSTTILDKGFNLRSAVSYGEVWIDEKEAVYVGKPIIEAVELEKAQAWAGGALTESAVDRIPEDKRSGTDPHWWIVPYEVPVSDDCKYVATHAIDWTLGQGHGDSMRYSDENIDPTQGDKEKNPKIVTKFLNTVEFYDAVCRRRHRGAGATLGMRPH